MKLSYVNSPEKDFSLGIDARSAENQIDPGFVRDLLNADIVEKRVRTRKGYQGYAGNIPFRVTKLEYNDTTNEACFTLDSAIDLQTALTLESVRSSPLVIYGRSSTFSTGPFTTAGDTVKYYSGFEVPLRKTLVAPSGTLTIPGTEHGLSTTNLFITILESSSLTDRSYSEIIPDAIRVDETSFDVSIDYTTYQDRNVFVVFGDRSTVTGSSYVNTSLAVGTGTQTITIPAGTHNLANFNIIPQIQMDIGTERIRIIPDSVVVSNTGTVTITVNNNTGSAVNLYTILSAAPSQNQVTGTVGALATSTIVIQDVTSPWIFSGIYLEVTPGGDRELVIPDSISYDDTTQDVTITFTNGSSAARNFIVYYEYGSIRSNQLCVTDVSIVSSGIDSRPQITIWGLEHSEVYNTKSLREAWTTHIDSYQRSGEQRLVCGLGGNLFSAREYAEAASQYAYPLLYPRLFARTSTPRILGPLFWDSSEAPQRSRGYITSTDTALHWARVTSVAYDSTNGWTRYTVSIPSKQILDSSGSPTTLASVISTTSNLEDWITIQGMSFSRHEGTFRIMQVQDGTDEIDVWVANDQSTNSDYDDSGTGGEAGVFTDQFIWSSTSPFIPEDTLVSDALNDTLICTVISSSGTTTVSDGLVDRVNIAGGVLFTGQRSSSVVPLRSSYPAAISSSTNLVRGDMLSYTDVLRQMRVLYINSDSDRTVNITEALGVATATLTSGDTSFLSFGQKVLLFQAGVYTGVVEITSIPSASTFTFDTTETGTVSGATLAGNTAQIDEELTWMDTPGDTDQFRVETRWIPLEAPDDSYNLTPSTYVRHLDTNDYTDQPFLRSTMVVDNMYLTNNSDEVYKLDGSNIYRSGLFAWQSGLFITQETTGATIVTNLRSISYSARVAAEGKLTITAATQNVIPVGQSVRLSGSSQTYTITNYTDDGTNYYVLLDRSLDAGVSASGTSSEIGTYRYYMRLNAVDSNNNIIASAVTGSQDHVVELIQNAAVFLKCVGLPAWDVYDYDRLELQIYRTKMNQAAPFYLITTLAMDFDNTQGYILYRDSFADTDLVELDIVNTALRGSEIGTNWSDSLRAKYITSIGNRLILGNVKDYPQLDIQIVGSASLVSTDFAGDSLLFRRSNTDTGTSTDMVNRVRYQWVNGFTGAASSFANLTNQFQFTTFSPTGAAVGDWVYLGYSTVATTARDLDYCGWWQIAAISGTTVTVNLVGAAAAANYPDRYAIAANTTDVPVVLGTDGNFGMVNGDSFDTFDAMRRMSSAINATMRMVDVTITGMTTFTPWLTTRSGNDVSKAGRLIVRQPRADNITPEVLVTFSGYDLFVNSVRRSTGDEISASTRVFPSRILVSYENYPEIIDSPTTILDSDSDSAIDINSADGQEITGIIPFFGEAAFGAAQQSGILVVFKSNSIYLVDVNQKIAGQNAVQRIETEGLGCTAPYSIAATKGGITFANESGIYCLRRNQTIQYIGRYMERNWTERVSLDALSIVQGHHYGIGRAYKLSVPITETATSDYIENSEVYVYNHTGEEQGRMGAWSRYNNHPAIGWANLASDAFFASTLGRVFRIRNTGLTSDCRDDSGTLTMRLQTRPNDFGNSGIRKVIDRVMVHYRVQQRSTGVTLSYALDLEQEYSTSTDPIIPRATSLTGTADVVQKDVITIMHNVSRRRCNYFSIQIENSAIDDPIEIAGIDHSVAGLLDKGILEAQTTRSR